MKKVILIIGLIAFIIIFSLCININFVKTSSSCLTIEDIKTVVAQSEGGYYPGTCSGSSCAEGYSEKEENYLCCWVYRGYTGKKKTSN